MSTKFRVALAGALLSMGGLGLAQAQSTTGNINGVAEAGDTIAVEGVERSFTRTVEVQRDGKYSVRRLPTGKYVVTRTRADGTVAGPKQLVEIHAGVTVRVE